MTDRQFLDALEVQSSKVKILRRKSYAAAQVFKKADRNAIAATEVLRDAEERLLSLLASYEEEE